MGLAAIVIVNKLDISSQRNGFRGLRLRHSFRVVQETSFLAKRNRRILEITV